MYYTTNNTPTETLKRFSTQTREKSLRIIGEWFWKKAQIFSFATIIHKTRPVSKPKSKAGERKKRQPCVCRSLRRLLLIHESPLAYGVSLCCNVGEKVFAINGRRAEALNDLSLRASHTQESISAPAFLVSIPTVHVLPKLSPVLWSTSEFQVFFRLSCGICSLARERERTWPQSNHNPL